MVTPYTTASELAKYIISYFQQAGDPITNLKLQKLLYYVQGWSLALLGRPAFGDELQAWVHGPVQPAVYGVYKANRWNPIFQEVSSATLDAELEDLVEEVLKVYGTDSAYELELRTHSEAPWLLARAGLSPDVSSTAVISPKSIKAYFDQIRADVKEESED